MDPAVSAPGHADLPAVASEDLLLIEPRWGTPGGDQ